MKSTQLLLGLWLSSALWLFMTPPSLAAEGPEGRWLAKVGPDDNRATVGLEVTRDTNGSLSASAIIDLIGIYGQPLGAVTETGPHTYSIPGAQLTLAVGPDSLAVGGFLADPAAIVTLKRVTDLPTPATRVAAPQGPGPAWRIRLGGAIFAAAAVRDAVAYVGNTDGVMNAVSVEDGRRVWTFAAGRAIYGEALVTADAVFFVCDNGYLFRLDRGTGKELWRYDLGDARARRVLPNPFIYDYDYRSPRPVMGDRDLYVGSGDGSLHAVRADTGVRVWRIDGLGPVRETVALLGAQLLVSTRTGIVRSVNRSDGKTQWQLDTKSPATAPAIVGGTVMVGTRDSTLYGIDPHSGKVLWSQYWWGSWVESAAAPGGSDAYIGAGDLDRVSRIDPATGHNRWRSDVGGWVLQQPLVTDTVVYAGVSGARRFAKFWQPQASGLAALDRATGQLLWHWPVPDGDGEFLHGFVAAPVDAGSGVLIGGVDGSLYWFRNPLKAAASPLIFSANIWRRRGGSEPESVPPIQSTSYCFPLS